MPARSTQRHKTLTKATAQAQALLLTARADLPEAAACASWHDALARRFAQTAGLDPTFLPAMGSDATLPKATARDITQLVAHMPEALFSHEENLAWAYPHWQAAAKTEANQSEAKRGPEAMAAVTQLFTDRYLVDFLIDNTLGAWWCARLGAPKTGPDFPYLRFQNNGDPIAGPFSQWPERAADLRVLDPCCGAGHFLVAAMERLVHFRRVEENLTPGESVEAVLRENLFGLELDARCVRLAQCVLTLSAWRLSGGTLDAVPAMQVACPGGLSMDAMDATDGKDDERAALLGSLLPAQKKEAGKPGARGMLARRYTLVATNVPFLARAKQHPRLQAFCNNHYPEARRDLATVFAARCLELCGEGGTAALLTPQNWYFLKSYRAFRTRLLEEATWHVAVRLGEGAFAYTDAAGGFSALTILSKKRPEAKHQAALLDAVLPAKPTGKAKRLKTAPLRFVAQAAMARSDNARIAAPESTGSHSRVADYADVYTGLQTGDNPRYIRCFWELPEIGNGWALQQSTPDRTAPYCGREQIVLWEDGDGALANDPQARVQGLRALGRHGIAVRLMRNLSATRYTGEMNDQTAALVIPRDPENLPALWAYFSSDAFTKAVRAIDTKVNLAPATVGEAPFDLGYWRRRAQKAGPLPPPASDEPTQWVFHGGLARSTDPLQTAMARLMGYRWPAEQAAPRPDGHARPVLLLAGEAACRESIGALRSTLEAAYGKAWNPARETELLLNNGVRRGGLPHWLRNRFFKQHCQLFKQRPFLWHIWDGLPDGFSAIVNYHALGQAQLQRLIADDLEAWLKKQSGAHLAAGRHLRNALEAIAVGEAPHDIFVRWKTLAGQATGWDPDLDDGVRLNIRPFATAGLLRHTPRIHWRNDRGTDRENAPWFNLFVGERRNGHHTTLSEKATAHTPWPKTRGSKRRT